MASNIFTELDYSKIAQRINQLQPDNQRKWGTMTLGQMLNHCSKQLELALGKIEQTTLEGNFIMRTGFGKWFALYALPWFRGLPTPTKMNVIKSNVIIRDFEDEKDWLLSLLEEVQEKRNLNPHPFFGSLSEKDWGRLIWKHLDYHLRQFNG